MRWMTTLTLGFIAVTGSLWAQEPADEETLDIYVIDVEGGEATLFVAPTGESMLVDTGWPGFDGRDADRIAAAAADAGVDGLDYLLVTHFHTDHMGGAHQLAERLPVDTYLDHGQTVDEGARQVAAFERYGSLRETANHQVVAPGDDIGLGEVGVTILASHGEVLESPLPGAGAPNPYCEGFEFHGPEITSRYGDAEDQRSVSAFIGYGSFRTVIMGDLTWNKEHPLMCPDNKIGTVDLYLVSHHGSDTSGAEALAHAIAPRAAVMNNGPRKGGAPLIFQILGRSPTLEDLWQNHYSIPAGPANAPPRFIANLQDFAPAEDEEAVHMGTSAWIKVSARRDGSFTVTNSRNGHSKDYPPN